MSKKVLVVGATGSQGGSVARALVERGHQVRALVRDAESEKARALVKLGMEAFEGTFEDTGALEQAMSGVDAVFALTTPFTSGPEAELHQGKALIDAAVAAQVPHFVFSSVSDADKKTGIPHFDSKYRVERYLAGSGLNWTITAPVFFIDNVLFPWNLDAISQGTFSQALPADRRLQVVSVRDIGRFNAAVIEGGSKHYGQRYDYAGDELNGIELAGALTKATGRDVSYAEQPVAQLRAQSEDLALMYEWFDKTGYSADIAALKQDFNDVGWQDVAEWAQGQNWNALLSRT